jgi:hypothetical protein
MATLTLNKPVKLTAPNYTTPYSYKRPTYMQLAQFTIECKNFNQYQLANVAFICLLHQSINSSVKLTWQSTNWSILQGYEGVLANPKLHRDLIVVDNGKLKVNIPATLLLPKYMKFTYINASELHIVPLKDRWCHPPRPDIKILPGQLEYLQNKLAKLVPNYKELASRYLQPKP